MPEKLKMPNMNPNDIGESVKDVIQQAVDQNRLTCGLLEAGQVLERSVNGHSNSGSEILEN